jgi:hypothetical protein
VPTCYSSFPCARLHGLLPFFFLHRWLVRSEAGLLLSLPYKSTFRFVRSGGIWTLSAWRSYRAHVAMVLATRSFRHSRVGLLALFQYVSPDLVSRQLDLP